MKDIVNKKSKDIAPTNTSEPATADQTGTSQAPENAIRQKSPGSNGARPMQIKRFLYGMLIASGGVGLMLTVAFGLLQGWGIKGDISLPAIGLCMILGLMLLGGGFGIMATASGTFDDDEFDRLMAGENRQLDEQMESHQPPVEFSMPSKETNPLATGKQANVQRLQTS